MISPVYDDALVAMRGVDVLVTSAVDTWNLRPAALAVHEIDRLPDAALPCVLADAERASERVPGADRIASGLPDFGEIENLIFSEACGYLLDCFGENSLSSL